MIYLYISNSKKQGIVRRNNDKYIMRNIQYQRYHGDFDAYIFNIREDQLEMVPKNNKHKIFIFKDVSNKHNVVKKVDACHQLHHKIYFIPK